MCGWDAGFFTSSVPQRLIHSYSYQQHLTHSYTYYNGVLKRWKSVQAQNSYIFLVISPRQKCIIEQYFHRKCYGSRVRIWRKNALVFKRKIYDRWFLLMGSTLYEINFQLGSIKEKNSYPKPIKFEFNFYSD